MRKIYRHVLSRAVFCKVYFVSDFLTLTAVVFILVKFLEDSLYSIIYRTQYFSISLNTFTYRSSCSVRRQITEAFICFEIF